MTDQTPGACPAGHAGELDTNGINYRVWCKTCHWAGPEARESQAAIAAWNARHDHGCGMGPCDNNDCTSWSCQQYRAEGAEARAEEAERGLSETIDQRDRRENEIEECAERLGCEDEWTSAHDHGQCIVERAESVVERAAAAESENARLKGELAEAEQSAQRLFELLESTRDRLSAARPSGHGNLLRALDASEAEVSRLKGELDCLKAEVGRLEGDLARVRNLHGPVKEIVAEAEKTLALAGSLARELVPKLEARISELERDHEKSLRETSVRTEHEHFLRAAGAESRLADAKLQYQADALLALEKCYMDPNPTVAPDWVNKAKRDRSDLSDAMLVIGALGLRPAAGGLHCKGVVYPGQLVMDAFERLGGKGEK